MQGVKYATDEERRVAHNEQSKDYYRSHRPEHASRVKDWAARHPRARLSFLLKSKYGITIEDYEAMVAAQGGKCAICGKVPHGRWGSRLVVDHDHVSQKVRGLLCSPCNRAIGALGDSVAGLTVALKYLTEALHGR